MQINPICPTNNRIIFLLCNKQKFFYDYLIINAKAIGSKHPNKQNVGGEKKLQCPANESACETGKYFNYSMLIGIYLK
jgi:hypothetical protein